MDKRVITIPVKDEDVLSLGLGDVVYLTGHIFTARDMVHLKLRELYDAGEPFPKDFQGADKIISKFDKQFQKGIYSIGYKHDRCVKCGTLCGKT